MFKEVGDHNDGWISKNRTEHNREHLVLFTTNSMFLIISNKCKLSISNHNTKENKTVHANVQQTVLLYAHLICCHANFLTCYQLLLFVCTFYLKYLIFKITQQLIFSYPFRFPKKLCSL